MKRFVLAAFCALALLAVQAPAGRAEPVVLSEEELDLITAGYAGSYTGTLYEDDGTTQAGTFALKIAKNGKVKGTVNVTGPTGRGKYKLSGLVAGAGFGGYLQKGKTPAGGFFASLAEAGTGYRVSGTWGVSSPSGALLAGGVFNGNSR